MDDSRITNWLKDFNGYLDPPGCESSLVSLPGCDRGSCRIGIVHEHRFAFYFWGLYSIEKNSSNTVLISIDAHDDAGVPSEVIPDDLDNLDIHNRTELGLFAWLRLRNLNDGHILPSLYLNFFSDVYVLLNDYEDSAAFRTNRTELQQRDYSGRIHAVQFHKNPESLLKNLAKDCPIFLDIDLDYFTIENPETGAVLGSEKLMPDSEIRSFLSINGPLLRPLFKRIIGLTIALEPKYCGGLANSLHVLNILNQELFEGTLCTNSCKWKESSLKG